MPSSEDYLDSLLNNISSAKTEINNTIEQNAVATQETIAERNRISADDDFMQASGIAGYNAGPKGRPNLRKIFTESDFLDEFEAEIEDGTADDFIKSFEREIEEEEREFEISGKMSDAEATVAALLDGIESEVKEAQEEIDAKANEELNLSTDVYIDNLDGEKASAEAESSEPEDDGDDIDLNKLLAGIENLEDEEPLVLTEEGSEAGESGADPMAEFAPDEHDALASDEEVDLSEGTELSLDELSLGVDDIDDILGEDGELEGVELDESVEESGAAEGTETAATADSESGDKKSKAKKKNPLFEKIKLFFMGPPDEEDDEVVLFKKKPKPVDENGNVIEKPKKEKKEKPKKEKKPKKAKPPKPPKPPKPKKEKPVDKSPKIPMGVILVMIVLAATSVFLVLLLTNYLGESYHVKLAKDYFDKKQYIESYESLNGYEVTDEDDIQLRDKARLLAELALAKTDYENAMRMEQYEFALDALIVGVGRYNLFEYQAQQLEIVDEYKSLYDELLYQLDIQFGVDESRALEIFNSKNRREFTVAIKQIIIKCGLEEK